MTSTERAIANGTAMPLNGQAEPLNYATASRPPLPQYDGQNLRPRRTVESADHADLPPTEALSNQDLPNYRSRDYSPEGQRSQPSWGPQYGGVGDDGTVDFHTQGRENVPVTIPENIQLAQAVERASVEPTPIAPATAESGAPAVEYYPEHTMTRRELRALREAGLITDVTDLSQPIPVQLPSQASVAEASALEAREVEEAPAAEEPPAAQQAPAAEASVFDVLIAEAPAAVMPFADPIPLVAPAPQSSTRLDSALAEFDALAAGREPLLPELDAPAPVSGRRSAGHLVADDVLEGAEPSAEILSEASSAAELFPQPASLPPSTEGLSAFDALFQPPSAAIPVVVALPVDSDVEHHDVVEAEIEPEPAPESTSESSVAAEPQPIDPLLAAPAPQGAPALVPPPPAYQSPVDLPAPPPSQSAAVASSTLFFVAAPPATPPVEQPVFEQPVFEQPVFEQPVAEQPHVEQTVGHWSTQAEIDDAEQLSETTISRSVGAGNTAITTSALVLPSVPDDAFGGPLGDHGEILLTGSISLPESFSSRGAHPSQLDESDLDHLLDPGDLQVANTDSTPVRAIRAVSTHTASGGIISPTKPKGTRGFTILIIAASVMAVVVVGLLVAGLVSGTL